MIIGPSERPIWAPKRFTLWRLITVVTLVSLVFALGRAIGWNLFVAATLALGFVAMLQYGLLRVATRAIPPEQE